MRIFFDNNPSPHLAHAPRELSRVENGVYDVIHLKDRFQASAPDVEWIRAPGETGPWTIISVDRFTKNNDAERAAIRNAGHSIFVLDRKWSEQKYWAVAERFVIW